MALAAAVLTALVALEHAYFLVLEMFLFDRPYGRKTFQITEAFSKEAKALAANQGLYNGFLTAGLVWALIAPEALRFPLAAFFLGCVVVAGVFGGFTVNRRILFLQAGPAAVALGLWVAARASQA